MAIDVGSPALDRNVYAALRSAFTGYRTYIDYNNPANDTGIIDTVNAWFNVANAGNSCKIGTFTDNGSGSFTCHDAELIGEVAAGSAQQYTGLSIDITTGEYIGADARAIPLLYLESDTSGGSGVYWIAGQYCDPSDAGTFALLADDILSLNGTGTEAGGTTHYGAATLAGIGTLAAIGQHILYGLASLSGIGTVAAIAQRIVSGVATLTGVGSISALAQRIVSGIATLTGSGTLVAKGVMTLIGKATISGVGTVSAIGSLLLNGVATLSGIGSLVASGTLLMFGRAVLSGTGAMTAIGRKKLIAPPGKEIRAYSPEQSGTIWA